MKNNYSDFIAMEDMKEELTKITSSEEIKESGIPLCYDDEAIYLDSNYGHTLAIGATGSGKTQSITLPKIFTILNSGENLVVDDEKGEIEDRVKDIIEKNKYNILKFDFNNYAGNKWNPLKLAYDLYKERNIDDAVMIIERIAYYIFTSNTIDNSDPFWNNSATNLFIGSTLYIIENEHRLPTIKDVAKLATTITPDEFYKLDNNSPAKTFLKTVMTAPEETRGSIFAVFSNKMMPFSYENRINEFLNESDFEIEELFEKKTALFIIDAHDKPFITNLVALFIEELHYVCNEKNNKKTINIILDDFNDFVPMYNFGRLLSNSRSINLEFTLLVGSLHPLREKYGDTALEHIVAQFVRVIYLFANDEYTLEKISNHCGNKNATDKLITTTDLKLLKPFEVIVFKNRHLPFRTNLLPFYQYPNK